MNREEDQQLTHYIESRRICLFPSVDEYKVELYKIMCGEYSKPVTHRDGCVTFCQCQNKGHSHKQCCFTERMKTDGEVTI